MGDWRTVMTAWNKGLADAVERVGTPEFPGRLEAALSALVHFDICMVFAYRGRGRPLALYDNMTPDVARVVVEDYLAGPYLLDPILGAVLSGRREGSAALRSLAPDRFYQSEYYRRHYIRTGIRDEVALFIGLPDDMTAVLSVTRQKAHRLFSPAEVSRLEAAAPVVRALGAAHWASLNAALPRRRWDGALDHPVETVLERLGQGVLTVRESEVVALILKGHSSDSIARNLEISHGTVKIHRKNAYHKLGISSQAELFSLFIAALRETLR